MLDGEALLQVAARGFYVALLRSDLAQPNEKRGLDASLIGPPGGRESLREGGSRRLECSVLARHGAEI